MFGISNKCLLIIVQKAKMKLLILFVTLICIAMLVTANAGTDEKITDEELQELISDYRELNTNDGKSAPVS